jgi:hypothetical protein
MLETSLSLIVITLSVIGLAVCAGAWLLAGRSGPSNHTADPRSAVLAGIGSGILTGAAVSLGVIWLQDEITREGQNAQWRLEVGNSWRIAGFDAHGKPYRSPTPINFSGKELPNADFHGLDLHGMRFDDAKLQGADFDGADLSGASFIHTDLSTATFIGANLQGAHLQYANLGFAAVEKAQTLGKAVSNAETCWPTGFNATKHWSQLVAAKMPVRGQVVKSKGHMVPCPLPEPVYAYEGAAPSPVPSATPLPAPASSPSSSPPPSAAASTPSPSGSAAPPA